MEKVNIINQTLILYLISLMTQPTLQPKSSFFLKCISLVETLIAVGDVQESIEIIQALLEVDPNHPGLHKKKAMALIKDNQFQNALKALELSIKYSSNRQKSEAVLYKADVFYSLQKYKESLEIYKLLHESNPERPQILYRIGLCILAMQRFKQATKVFDQVLAMDPDYVQCYIMNAHSFFMQKKYKKAIRCLSKVTDKNDFQNADALYLKASCFYNLNLLDQCQRQLKQVFEIDYGHVEIECRLKQNRKPKRIRRVKSKEA